MAMPRRLTVTAFPVSACFVVLLLVPGCATRLPPATPPPPASESELPPSLPHLHIALLGPDGRMFSIQRIDDPSPESVAAGAVTLSVDLGARPSSSVLIPRIVVQYGRALLPLSDPPAKLAMVMCRSVEGEQSVLTIQVSPDIFNRSGTRSVSAALDAQPYFGALVTAACFGFPQGDDTKRFDYMTQFLLDAEP